MFPRYSFGLAEHTSDLHRLRPLLQLLQWERQTKKPLCDRFGSNPPLSSEMKLKPLSPDWLPPPLLLISYGATSEFHSGQATILKHSPFTIKTMSCAAAVGTQLTSAASERRGSSDGARRGIQARISRFVSKPFMHASLQFELRSERESHFSTQATSHHSDLNDEADVTEYGSRLKKVGGINKKSVLGSLSARR